MSLDLFRVAGGLDLQSDDFSSNAYVLQESGLPGGDAGKQDAAPIGSVYMRTDVEANNLQLYYKWSTAFNSAQDWKAVSDQAYVDAAINGLSWREPVRLRDDTVYANAAAFPVGGIIDSISLNDQDRVLFSNVTIGTDENVFIWNSGGSTWTEDPNAESDGDAILVQEGTSSDQQFVYDGSSWVQFGSGASVAELGYMRTFMGKTGPGSELPTYSSTDAIAQSSNLEVAIGVLDSTLGDGEITSDGGNNALSDDFTWNGILNDGTLNLTSAFNEINDAIGDRTYTNDNVVTDGEAIANSIDALDTAVGDNIAQTSTFSGSNVAASTTITVDTITLADSTLAKWIIQVREFATPANRRALEVLAMNDGLTLVDHTEYAVLKLGSPVAGLDIAVDINGTDMRLRITATNNIDYVVRRVAYTAF